MTVTENAGVDLSPFSWIRLRQENGGREEREGGKRGCVGKLDWADRIVLLYHVVFVHYLIQICLPTNPSVCLQPGLVNGARRRGEQRSGKGQAG